MKKVVLALLSFVIVFALVPLTGLDMSAKAAETYTEGYYTYSVSNGEATITSVDEVVSGDITIPATLGSYPVTKIARYAFDYCKSITDVVIPDSVTYMDRSIFYECTALETVTIGSGVKTIDINGAMFFGCTSLDSINVSEENAYFSSTDGVLFNKNKTVLIEFPKAKKASKYSVPDGVQRIEKEAFANCIAVDSVSLPEGLITIEENAFYECTSIKNIDVADSVNKIGNYAFCYCTALESVNLPEGVKVIEHGTFSMCESLEGVSIPKSVESIELFAFFNCESLENVWYGGTESNKEKITIDKDGNTPLLYATWHYAECDHEYLDDLDFDCDICGFNRLFTYEINNGEVTITGLAMFDEEDVKIPSEIEGCPVTAIGDKAFYNVIGVEWITMPSTLKRIGEKAFSGCYSLLAVIIPERVEYIGAEAFADCTCNTSFTVVSGNEYYSSENGVLFNKDKTVLIQYPLDFSPREYTILNSVEVIESYAFYDAHNLTTINIPLSVKTIKPNAFKSANIKTIRYAGSEDDRAEMVVASEGNSLLSSFAWVYNHSIYCSVHKYDDECDAICNICKFTRDAPHSYDNGEVIAPTISEQGYTKYTCTLCGKTTNSNFTDALNKVSNVKVTASDVDVTISWDKYEGASKYYVRGYKPDGSVLTTKTISDGALSAVFKGLEYDTEYTFIVYGKVGTQYLLPENATEVKASLVLEKRVVGLKSSVKGRVIAVSWKEYPNASNYFVFVYPKGADPTVTANRITTVNAGNNTSVEIINAISPEVEYDIYVSARVGGKYMTLENALRTTAIIPVTPPTSFEVTSIEPTVIRIKWNAVKNADRYWARLVDEDGNVVVTKVSIKALVSFTKLTPNTTYYVQLQARVPRQGGGSVYSGYCDPISIPIVTPNI